MDADEERENASTDESDPPFDLGRLTAEERMLWDEFFSSPCQDAPAIRIWGFGYACMLKLGPVPDVVVERLKELDPDNLILQYQENVRRARSEGRLRSRR